MFIFNMKINKNLFSKILFIIMLIIISAIIFYGIYIIFFKDTDFIKVTDTIKSDEIFEVTSENYTNILQAANNNIDSYVGCKIHLTGYIYRLLDFEENQFVIARDMLLSEDSYQSLIVGFLCEYDKAQEFEDNTWVDIVGEIKKGDYNGEIAILKITSIETTEKPEDYYVSPPDDTYIPTANMF